MAKKDLFYQDVEGRMEEMKQQPIKKEKSTRGEKINKIFKNIYNELYEIEKNEEIKIARKILKVYKIEEGRGV